MANLLILEINAFIFTLEAFKKLKWNLKPMEKNTLGTNVTIKSATKKSKPSRNPINIMLRYQRINIYALLKQICYKTFSCHCPNALSSNQKWFTTINQKIMTTEILNILRTLVFKKANSPFYVILMVLIIQGYKSKC